MEGLSINNLIDTLAPGASAGVEELHGCMPVDDLAETWAWLKAHEREGYEFMKCVSVNMEGQVIWLRGDPGEWN